ncbi:electron transport complex subunit RsxC [bacterium]|nr:electron transport complex subunit RsxC [bacterium]
MNTKTFPHGIHPPEYKEETAEKKLQHLSPPDKVFIPLSQHFGRPADPLVKKGDPVDLGQKIGKAPALFSAAVHSSVSGKVLKVGSTHHPSGKPLLAITIKNDGEDRLSSEVKEVEDPFSLSPDRIRERVKEAGIVGLGGAAFPTAVKLAPPKDKPIDTILINGCECEPVLTSDYRMMMEYSDDILQGAELIRKATGAEKIIVGIEDNKKKALSLFQEKTKGHPSTSVALLKTKYPQGAEKNLIYALLRREVPRGGLPFDVGVVVQNVGTTKVVYDGVKHGVPLYQRSLTVAGSGIGDPQNLMVRLGTPFQKVIDFCGGLKEDGPIVVMGGPMMGISQWTLDVPVIKGTSGILAWKLDSPPEETACIRCGRCISHCPMRLAPTQIKKYVEFEHLSEAEEWGVLDCVECGCCQYICPSKIPLVHWMRLGKAKVSNLKRKKKSE